MNARDLINSLGVSHFNAAMVIQIFWSNPATTDPKSPGVVMLVEYLQRALIAAGGDAQGVTVNGRIDDATNAALEALVPGWLFQPWSKVTKAVLDFRDSGGTFKAGPVSVVAQPMSGLPMGLPDVPGGLLTYAAAAAVAWHFWKKRKR